MQRSLEEKARREAVSSLGTLREQIDAVCATEEGRNYWAVLMWLAYKNEADAMKLYHAPVGKTLQELLR